MTRIWRDRYFWFSIALSAGWLAIDNHTIAAIYSGAAIVILALDRREPQGKAMAAPRTPAMEELDFIRALNERPVWIKLLFRLVVGESAYREFLFMVNNIQGYGPCDDYGLHDHEYHKDSKPWRWWKAPSAASHADNLKSNQGEAK